MSDAANVKSNAEIISYGLGRQMGAHLAEQNLDSVDLELVQQGLEHAFNGMQSPITNDQFKAAFDELQQTLRAKAEQLNQQGIAAGQAYLEENAKREGVQVTGSGLQYEVLQQGSGPKPTASSVVRTHYHGQFVSGEVFDSSVQRNQPAEFAVGGVIAGWTEALQMMPVGSKWRLTIPADLAYGAQGAGNAIPPHATLLFEIELLDIIASE